jgi:hypothetical protein
MEMNLIKTDVQHVHVESTQRHQPVLVDIDKYHSTIIFVVVALIIAIAHQHIDVSLHPRILMLYVALAIDIENQVYNLSTNNTSAFHYQTISRLYSMF